MPHRVVLIPGDGIGPEVTAAARRCLDATGVPIAWEVAEASLEALERYGTPVPEATLEAVRRTGVALKGPQTSPRSGSVASPAVRFRELLGLYANVRPCKSYPGLPTPFRDVDLVIIREITEDLPTSPRYDVGSPGAKSLIRLVQELEGCHLPEDAAIGLRVISATASRRIARFAMLYARDHDRHRVTAIHKASATQYCDRLFLTACQEVAPEFPDIAFDDETVDAVAMKLVRRPQEFDVLVAPYHYGDILSDLCAGLVGGLGMAPGVNYGEGIAVFEATHGSAPKYASLNKVNPMAVILSGVLMLRHLGETAAADRLEGAVAAVIAEGRSLTYDLKRDRHDPTAVGTSEVAEAIIAKLG